MISVLLSSPKTVRDTVQYKYCIFSLLYRLLRIRLKRQNPLLSYYEREREREREKLHYNCTVKCTVNFIITLFNVGNVLLCVIFQLNSTLFTCVIRISRYITLYIALVLSAVSRNCGRSWNVLPVDTAARLYMQLPSISGACSSVTYSFVSLKSKHETRRIISKCHIVFKF